MDLVGGFNSSEKYEFVNWDDDIPNGKMKNVPNHQAVYILICVYGIYIDFKHVTIFIDVSHGIKMECHGLFSHCIP